MNLISKSCFNDAHMPHSPFLKSNLSIRIKEGKLIGEFHEGRKEKKHNN